ncbi:hypothetical protein PDE_09674 [Penicillium oxalicum 114-2]|uniref:ER transporter 6TM N-terminal domain-containing protein n=1 Tax=Penicillium oxalicum (strain 114-2 / CGMCC 5302) TaxID=933388 RepID=S7ZVE0_PENO1|nr:hypothetical protein PDE_09674 [Penicillium oxalicum 114-2]
MQNPAHEDAAPNAASPAASSEAIAEAPTKASTSPASRKLPAWLDHFNARDLKVLFRCTVAAWVASLLIFINPALRTIGTATFFATLVLFMVPPNGILFIFLLGTLTLIIGMGLGWGWGVIAMKAALAARPAAATQAQLQALGQKASSLASASGQPIAAVQKQLIYEGAMLDARVSSVYFCLICFFVYVLSRIRAKNPKFTLTQIFGIIIMDIFITIGPLLPRFNGTLPKILIEPAAIGIGIGMACNVLFFPTSTSYVVLEGMEAVVRLLKGPLDATVSSLMNAEHLEVKDLHKLKMKILATWKSNEPAIGFLQLDFSVSRWNADDIKSLREPIRRAALAGLSHLDYHIARLGGEAKLEKLREVMTDSDLDTEVNPTEKPNEKPEGKSERWAAGRRQLLESLSLVRAFTLPEHEALRQDMLEAVRQPCSEILPVLQEAIVSVADSINAINSSRWFRKPSEAKLNELLQRCESSLAALGTLRVSFAAEATERLIQSTAEIFDESGMLKDRRDDTLHKVRGLAVGMVFEEQILVNADAWEKVLGQLVALMKERTKARLWLPRGLRYAVNWVFRKSAVAPVLASQSTDVDPDMIEEQSKAAQESLNLSRGFKVKRRSGLGRIVLGTYHWLINAEGMYALRMVVVTVALAIPAVIPSSAGFYYREKGLWALIMGQTTLVIYMSDFTLSLASRFIGTIVGGVAGLVAWYIGSGGGPGNPYGLAAVMAVILLLLMWGRIFAPPALLAATIMGGATCILIIGYSYDDTHIPTYGNPGWGYNVFWRRLLLVLIGAGAALIIQVLPRPPSAARHICKSMSNVIRSLSDHYALLLSCWGQPDREEGLVAEKLALNLAESISALDGPVALLRLEFSGSPFDSETLTQIKSICYELNRDLGKLLHLSASLPEHFQTMVAQRMGLLDHRNIGDVMAVLGVVEQALKTGDPLPEVLPTPLLNRTFAFWQLHQAEIELTTDLIRDENYRRFCVAVTAYLKFLSVIDDLVLIMKGALGESHIVRRKLTDV